MGSFGERLREARKRARLSQQALADKVAVDDSYISKMETEVDRPPTREVVLKLAGALGLEERTAGWGAFLLAAGVLSEEDVEGFALIEVEDSQGLEKPNQNVVGHSRALKSGTQGKPMTLSTMASNPALALPDSLLYITFDQIEAIVESAHHSEEEMRWIAAGLIESTKMFSKLAKLQHQK